MRRVLAVGLFCLGLLCLGQQPSRTLHVNGAHAQDMTLHAGSPLKAPAGASCTPGTPATNFLARTSGLSATETTAYCNLINGLVTDSLITGNLSGATGCGTVLDGLYIFATNTTTTANLNLCGTSFGLTKTGSVTFTADTGYTGDASTGFLDTGFAPALVVGNWMQDSASEGIYVLTNRTTAQDKVDIGSSDAGAGHINFIRPHNSGGNYMADLNATTFPATANTSAQGQWTNSRTGSTNFIAYHNGSSFATLTSTAIAMSSSTIYICAFNQNGTAAGFSDDQISAAYFGRGLNATEAANMQSRINAFMTALGINVYP